MLGWGKRGILLKFISDKLITGNTLKIRTLVCYRRIDEDRWRV